MLNKLVIDNYKELKEAANNITRRRDRNQSNELINETYLTLFNKVVPETNAIFVKWFTKSMKYIYIDKYSSFRKATDQKESSLTYDTGNSDWKDIELGAEQINEKTKGIITGLSHLTNDKALKYVELLEFKESLPPHERELFELHFEKGLSGRKISKLMEKETGFKMSYVRYNEMIKVIKNKIDGRS